MRNVSFNTLAEQELAEAVEYYESESPGLGQRLLEEVRYSTLLIGRFPHAAPAAAGAIRRFVLPRFPYHLLYRLSNGRARILAVAHQKRRPGYWKGRS